jgi:hypothetical protein
MPPPAKKIKLIVGQCKLNFAGKLTVGAKGKVITVYELHSRNHVDLVISCVCSNKPVQQSALHNVRVRALTSVKFRVTGRPEQKSTE